MNENKSKTLYVLSFAWQLGFLIVIPMVGFMALGLWVDGKLNTKPTFTLIGLLVGVVSTVLESAKMLRVFMRGDDKK